MSVSYLKIYHPNKGCSIAHCVFCVLRPGSKETSHVPRARIRKRYNDIRLVPNSASHVSLKSDASRTHFHFFHFFTVFRATLLRVGFLFPRFNLTNQEEKQVRNRQSKFIFEFIMGSWFSKAWNSSSDIPDLSGKVIVVTGAKFVVNVQHT